MWNGVPLGDRGTVLTVSHEVLTVHDTANQLDFVLAKWRCTILS